MSEETTCTLYGESLGEAATHQDLVPFYARFREAAENDPRVKRYGRDEIKDRDGEVVAYRITLYGTVTATDFVNEVFENKHGAW